MTTAVQQVSRASKVSASARVQVSGAGAGNSRPRRAAVFGFGSPFALFPSVGSGPAAVPDLSRWRDE